MAVRARQACLTHAAARRPRAGGRRPAPRRAPDPGSVGSAARQASYAAEAQGVLHGQAVAARDGVSGVNLDEEAADMLRLQQAYQAAAQIISTADTMFQTILKAVG